MPSFALCDVFTDRPFCGNPLAVFLDANDVSERLMGALAKEFGWSEVAFVLGDRFMEIEQGTEIQWPSVLLVEVSRRGRDLGAVLVTGSVRIWSTGTMSKHVLQGYS